MVVVLVALAAAATLAVVLQASTTPPSEVADQLPSVAVVVEAAAPTALRLPSFRGLIKHKCLFLSSSPAFYFCVLALLFN